MAKLAAELAAEWTEWTLLSGEVVCARLRWLNNRTGWTVSSSYSLEPPSRFTLNGGDLLIFFFLWVWRSSSNINVLNERENVL